MEWKMKPSKTPLTLSLPPANGHRTGAGSLSIQLFAPAKLKRKILQLSRFSREIIIVGIALFCLLVLHLVFNFRSGGVKSSDSISNYSGLRSGGSGGGGRDGPHSNFYFVADKNGNNAKVGVRRAKILCYVLLSVKKVEAAQVIKETWGSKCDKLLFFGRFNNSELPVTFLNTNEGYRFLWGKTKAALVYLEENYSRDYDWFFKADDDTFAVMENLRHFVKKMDPKLPVWFGYKLRHPKLMTGYMSGGAGYVFSRAALQNVTRLFTASSSGGVVIPPQMCKTNSIQGIEDLELGKCFKTSGVSDISTLDGVGRERFLPLPIKTLWTGQVPNYHWIWRQAWNPLQLGSKCCSSHVISMHQITPERMKTLHATLYLKKIPKENELKVDTITI